MLRFCEPPPRLGLGLLGVPTLSQSVYERQKNEQKRLLGSNVFFMRSPPVTYNAISVSVHASRTSDTSVLCFESLKHSVPPPYQWIGSALIFIWRYMFILGAFQRGLQQVKIH